MNQHITLIRFFLCLASAFILSLPVHAQIPTIQDCLGAIPVCQQVYSETNSTTGQGNYSNEVNPFSSCLSGEDNSVWYTFTVNESGDFGFLLTPNNSSDDYDWGLYNITNANCSEIYSNSNLLVSCNAAGGNTFSIDCDAPTGATGNSNYDNQGAGCGNFPPDVNWGYTPENDLVPVIEGNTYVLMVANWTGSPFGYTIDFGISDVGIFDFQNPEIAEIEFPEDCIDDEINIIFNENVSCSSLDPSNFQLNGPGGPFTIVINSDNCELGALYAKEFVLTTSPPISESGIYTLTLCCVLDVCDNELQQEERTFDIIMTEEPTLELGPDTVFCDGTVLTLDVSNDQASYQWQDGSTDPVYAISQTGDYAVTVSNACGTVSDEISILAVEFPPIVEFGNPQEALCPGDVLDLDVFNENASYLWNDGQTGSTFTIDSEGTYAVTVTNACGTSSDAVSVSIVAPIVVDLPTQLSPCSDDDLVLDVSNETAKYLWEDGSENPIRYIDMDGTYAVTVSNDCEEVTASINIEFIFPPNIDLGPDQVLCDGESIVLDANFPGASYTWQDGQTSPDYPVNQAGQYEVVVANDCGSISDSITISYVPNVEFELGEDAFFCDGPVLLEAGPEHDFATYQWQSGLGNNNLLAEEPGTYWLQLDSGCKIETDTITFFPCEICEVYVPNAFSPNNDGFNDFFQTFTPCEMDQFSLKIFDRWGGQLYDSGLGLPGMWDGTAREKKLPPGTYLWLINFDVTLNGEMFSRQMTGVVNLLR